MSRPSSLLEGVDHIRMRVLHIVATDKRRGAEIFASDLVRALREAHVCQRVCILRSSDTSEVGFDASTSRLRSGRWSAPGLKLNVETFQSLRGLIAAWKPDIIQAHGGEALKYSIPASLGMGTAVVYRKIGAAPPWIMRGPRRAFYGMLIRRAARVIAVSESVRAETIDLYRLAPDHVAFIPNGVDTTRLVPTRSREQTRRSLGLPLTAPLMISLGALTWEKDPLAHVEIARKVRAHHPETRHIIVGDGPLREEVERAVRDSTGHSQLLGSRTDVPDLLSASDVLLLASRTEGMEGMPAVVIEAGMAGLPVAAFSIAGVPEVVIHERTGLLAPPGNHGELASCVRKLLDDDDVRLVMGAEARKLCRRFDMRAVAALYLQVYEDFQCSSTRQRMEALGEDARADLHEDAGLCRAEDGTHP